MDKKYQIFISSTYEDLKEERAKVMGVLLENNCIPVGMEQFPSSNLSQWDYIKKMIDMSDYYILISAGRYGSINETTGISYTEQEFDYAIKNGIPVLSFLHKAPDVLPMNKCESLDAGREHIKIFREKVKGSNRLVKFYNNIDELATMVATSVNNIIHDCPRSGWVRAEKVEAILHNSDYVDELKNLQKMIFDMQKTVTNKIEDTILKYGEITKEDIDALFEDKLSEHTATDEEVKQAIDEVFGNPSA